MIGTSIIFMPIMVFFVFYLRDFWPSSRISASLKNSKNKSDGNRLTLLISTYAIKVFYLFAKHFIGTFPLYLIFLNRLSKDDQQLMYGVQVLSAYASTISIFIHTLKFKRYIGPITAMIAYDIIIPWFAYCYYNMGYVILRNLDVAMLCGVALVLNLAPSFYRIKPWLVWQICVAYMFYTEYDFSWITEYAYPYLGLCIVTAALLFRK